MGHTACMVGPRAGIAGCGNRKWWNRGSSLAGSLLMERRWVSPVTKSTMTKATQPGLPRGSGSKCDVHPGRVNLAHLDEGDGKHGDAVEHGAPLLLQPGWTSGWQSSLVQPHHKDLGNLVSWSSHLDFTIWAITNLDTQVHSSWCRADSLWRAASCAWNSVRLPSTKTSGRGEEICSPQLTRDQLQHIKSFWRWSWRCRALRTPPIQASTTISLSPLLFRLWYVLYLQTQN